VVKSYLHGNESSGSVRGGAFLDQLTNIWLCYLECR